MKVPECVVYDFETYGIDKRPDYPPVPVSVAIKWPGKKTKFYAWGHPSENNCTYEDALRALKEMCASGLPLLAQNHKFELAIMQEHFGLLRGVAWDRVHDTMFLLFLQDPYAPTFSLKPSAERYLGLPPEEQDAVADWLVEHQPVEGIKINKTKGKNGFGAYIAYAPGKLVGKYCVGDVGRTEKLFKMLYKLIAERGMLEAYDTERELMPILLRNEQEGMRTNVKQLLTDTAMYESTLERTDEWLRKKLGARDLNIDSDAQLADALDRAGVVQEWAYTKPTKNFPNGQKSVSKANLVRGMFSDERVYRMLTYRNKLAYSLATFMRPWSETATATGGTIHTNWNQVMRQGAGAITGRLSSNPNFQNITKNVKEDEKDADGYRHPAFVKWLPLLPSLRMYILPDRGQMFGHRDFCQQELRILAEFEDADLFRMYRANPDLDVHELVQGLLADAGKPLERGQVKGFNFGILYGMGATGLSRRLGVSKGEARNLITTWNNVMPGVATLVAELKEEVRGGGEIVTWGGRRYGMPPPMWEGDEQRDRDYVLLNYLIQGSGADATKRAMIEFYKRKRESRIIVNVHDEINFSCPKGAMAQEQKILKKVIEDLKFDVGMKSDGKAGKCWGDMTKWKD